MKTVCAIFLSSSAMLAASAQPSPAQTPPTYAQQGWSSGARNFWYSAPQGSRLMPLSWLEALERAQDSRLFLSPDNIASFRYLPGQGALPVGFAVDRQNDRRFIRTRLEWLPNQRADEPWVGMTCSACHTGEIAAGERRLRIEGAPSLGDYQSFVGALDAAVRETRNDQAKWARFAARILPGARNTTANRERLGRAFDLFTALRGEVARMNGRPLDYGFARVDAFGHIYNQTSIFSGANPPTANPSNAPVSYPFLWNVPQHDRVQWNGAVPNKRVLGLDLGAIGRNSGEVIGVFGEVMTERRTGRPLQSFASSINVLNLARLEQMLGELLPPAWPEDMLGP
ncbi:MAG TPA: di-heme-cytochrome C peroxidase, partial [Allosphingosinicella sp.]|nr:di-heme-cytochrome C peroxidase [Allosphingosinicella sp.]